MKESRGEKIAEERRGGERREETRGEESIEEKRTEQWRARDIYLLIHSKCLWQPGLNQEKPRSWNSF